MTLKKGLAVLILFYFLAPFLVLIYKFPLVLKLDLYELGWAMRNSFYQASMSALGSLILGTWVALGLIKVSGKMRHFFEILCLIPNFLPPLFILLVILYWVEPFPVGILGVAFVHTSINFGLVAISLARSIEGKIGGMAELARIEGAGRFRFYRSALLPILKKDFLFLFLFVFSICFSSFSVPLIVGGGKGTTIEMLIYEKMRLSLDWSSAVLLSMIQVMTVGFFAWLLIREKPTALSIGKRLPWFGHWSGLFALGSFSVMLLFGYLDGVWEGLPALGQFYEMRMVLLSATWGSLIISLSAGFLVLFLLLALTFVVEFRLVNLFVRSYVAPSTTLTGFAFLVLDTGEGWLTHLKIPLAMGLIFSGPLFRLGWESEIQRLRGQLDVAELLGANSWSILRHVMWPQVSERAFLLAGIASAWACGDFALSRILAYKDLTLGLMAETLMSSYRLNMATLLSGAVLVVGIFCFSFFWSLGYVNRRKSF